MGKTLVLELPEDVIATVSRAAEADGKTPEEWVAESIRKQIAADPLLRLPPEIQAIYRETARKMAAKYGKTPEEVLAEYWRNAAPKPMPRLSEEERRAADERLARHIGAVSLGHPTGADNESIDADLAREYAGLAHEED